MRAPAKETTAGGANEERVDTQYKYEGRDDDRPLLWREPLNELQGAINELMVKRKKKLGASLSKADGMTPMDDNMEPNLNRPRSAHLSSRASGRRKQMRDGPLRTESRTSRASGDRSRSRERPGSSGHAGSSRSLTASRDLPGAGTARAYSSQGGNMGGRQQQDDDWDDFDDEELLNDDDDDDDYAYQGPEEDDGAPREPGGGEDPRLREARREQLQKARDEYRAKCKELDQVRASLSSEDVLLKIRKSHSQELQTSVTECEEGAEQAHTWIKALEDVHRKRKAKLQEHDAKFAKAKKAIEESEAALEELQLERTAVETKYTRDKALHFNTGEYSQKSAV